MRLQWFLVTTFHQIGSVAKWKCWRVAVLHEIAVAVTPLWCVSTRFLYWELRVSLVGCASEECLLFKRLLHTLSQLGLLERRASWWHQRVSFDWWQSALLHDLVGHFFQDAELFNHALYDFVQVPVVIWKLIKTIMNFLFIDLAIELLCLCFLFLLQLVVLVLNLKLLDFEINRT